MKNSKTKPKTKTTKTDIDLKLVLDQMIEWSFQCGEILNSHLIDSYKKPLKVIDKGKQGVTTQADVLSEKFVMDQISHHYPSHKILSEEDAFTRDLKMEGVKNDEYLWLIDPLDGTNNFYNKVPFFCVSLALSRGSSTIVAVVYNPVNCELFYAIRGEGAYLVRLIGEREVRVQLRHKKAKKSFKEALLSANMTSKRVEKDLLKEFPEVRAMRRFGSAALEMSYVAAGMLDAYWEHKLKPWDMAAAGLICEEAGVKISTMMGEKYHAFASSVLCADSALYSPLLSILNKK
jgi:myo-inositol-1(or 4)-monophosphatase